MKLMKKLKILLVLLGVIAILTGCSNPLTKDDSSLLITVCTVNPHTVTTATPDPNVKVTFSETIILKSRNNEIQYISKFLKATSPTITDYPILQFLSDDVIGSVDMSHLAEELSAKDGIKLKIVNSSNEMETIFTHYYEHDLEKVPFESLTEEEQSLIGYVPSISIDFKFLSRYINKFYNQENNILCIEY